MVAKKKNDEKANEQNDEQNESQVEDPTAEKRAAMGDMRVPSNPLRPADIPPKPLTRSEYSETK
jgi:hypothetical protein